LWWFVPLLLGDDPDGVDDAGDVGEEGEQQADPELDLQVRGAIAGEHTQSEITRVILTVVTDEQTKIIIIINILSSVHTCF
jgi:hypothetical protein